MSTVAAVLALWRQGRWTAAHDLVQQDPGPLAAWLHGALHVIEGDLEDAEYWYGRAGRDFRQRGDVDAELQAIEAAAVSAPAPPPAP